MRFIVASIPTTGQATVSVIDAIDEHYAATQRGADDADVWVFPEADAKLFRRVIEPTVSEVPAGERTRPEPVP